MLKVDPGWFDELGSRHLTEANTALGASPTVWGADHKMFKIAGEAKGSNLLCI